VVTGSRFIAKEHKLKNPCDVADVALDADRAVLDRDDWKLIAELCG
jgi:hypothetical protein